MYSLVALSALDALERVLVGQSGETLPIYPSSVIALSVCQLLLSLKFFFDLFQLIVESQEVLPEVDWRNIGRWFRLRDGFTLVVLKHPMSLSLNVRVRVL